MPFACAAHRRGSAHGCLLPTAFKATVDRNALRRWSSQCCGTLPQGQHHASTIAISNLADSAVGPALCSAICVRRSMRQEKEYDLRCAVQFVYDAWYAYLTPDREFPADIRRALNCAFGELAARSRLVDLRAVLR